MRCCGCAKRRSGWLEMLKLRRGVVGGTDPLVVQVGAEREARLGGSRAGRRGPGGRRGGRQRRGARPRARLGRLRRRPRQPDSRARSTRRGRGGGDEAQLHLAPASGRAGGGPAGGGRRAADSGARALPPRTARPGGLGRRSCGERAAGGLRPDGRRCPARSPVDGCRRASRARAALRARHGRARLRRRARGALGDRSAWRRGGAARLGCGDRRAGAGHRRFGQRAGARRHGRARHGARRTRPGSGDPARAAPVERRPAGATPRPEPSHRVRAADAASGRPGAGSGRRIATRSIACGTPAATGMGSGPARQTSTSTRRAASPRATWGVRSRRTVCSSPPRSPPGTALAAAALVGEAA